MGGTFHGATVLTLDAKGRLAIPTRYREALAGSAPQASRTLVLTAHPEGCALLYPEAEWERVRAQVEKFPSFDPRASWWKRLLLGFEEHLVPDASGRVLISSALRMHARLERDAMLVGQSHYFELWDPGVWNAKYAAALEGSGSLPPGMENFSL